MKRIIFALCLLIAVTSCVSKKKYMVAENGRLAALSRERVLNRNLGQQKDEIAKLPSINYRPKSMRKTHVFKVY